jgi:hypothetical protein
MDYEKLANSMNQARIKNGQPEIPKPELIAMLKQSATDISSANVNAEEKIALSRMKDAMLEREIAQTPMWIKIVWAIIMGGVIYYFIN